MMTKNTFYTCIERKKLNVYLVDFNRFRKDNQEIMKLFSDACSVKQKTNYHIFLAIIMNNDYMKFAKKIKDLCKSYPIRR